MRDGPLLLLVVATLAALAVIPDWPHRHLDDPAYWGMIGYLGVFALMLARRGRSWRTGGANRRTVVLFLVGLPLIYLAAALRFDAPASAVILQAAGTVVWVGFAVAALRRDLALWLGCAAHALWDVAHFRRVDYIPDWYVVACVAVDVGLGAYVLLRLSGEARA